MKITVGLAMVTLVSICLAGGLTLAAPPDANSNQTEREAGQAPPVEPLPSVAVARGQARLLHAAISKTLAVVHHQYYREDEGLTLPAAALRNVFGEMAREQRVELRWLAVNASAMNVDHAPRDAFEKQAVAALADGQKSYESSSGGVLRHVGPIALTSDCLKCHQPNRTSTQTRLAGLLIAIPFDKN